MIDYYLWGDCNRISPEAPVPLINIQKETSSLGGVGNVANNLLALKANCTLLSVIGDDEIGQNLENILSKKKINHFVIKEKNRKTTKKTRIIATHSQVIRYDNESSADISSSCEDKLFAKFKEICCNMDIVLISDYAKGVVTDGLCKKIISYATKCNKKVIIDPKGKDYSKYNGAYLLTPNKLEAKKALDIEIKDNKSIEKALKKLKKTINVEIPLVTLSEDGIAYFDNKLIIKPTVAKNVYDVTGAGDTILSSLGYCLAKKMDISSSVNFANISAGIVVAKIGTATASLDEIQNYQKSTDKIEYKIKSTNEIINTMQEKNNQNKKIIFTNGCFDLLHRGHCEYLHKAKQLGDMLIVGLNDDKSVSRLKGKNRPINNQDDRAYILASLSCVDYVVVFSQDTPLELIKMIKPAILVKGGDYKNKTIIGEDEVKEVVLVECIKNKSTSNIIKKIKNEHKKDK